MSGAADDHSNGDRGIGEDGDETLVAEPARGPAGQPSCCGSVVRVNNCPRNGLRVLGFGTYDVATHPRVGVLLDGLRARGHRVRELDLPLGFSTAERVRMLRQPWRLPALAARLAQRWGGLGLGSRAFRGGARPDAIVVGYLGHFDVLLARALWPRRGGSGGDAPTLVLDNMIFAAGTAADRGAGPGLRTRALERLDLAALRAADVVVLDTEEHAQRAREVLAAHGGPGHRRLVIAPVGAPEPWFAARAGGADQNPRAAAIPLRVVFYGLFTPLQGTQAIARALRALADAGDVELAVTLVGSGQDEAEVRKILGIEPGDAETHRGGVALTWIPWVEADELPALVAAHDVCLGIVGTSAKARAVVPNKVYQGAAAGCAVITSDTPPQRRALGDAGVLVPPGDADALADALRTLATDHARLAAVRTACARLADAQFTPEAVTADLAAELQEHAVPDRPARGHR